MQGMGPSSTSFHFVGCSGRVFSASKGYVVGNVNDCEGTTRLVCPIRASVVEIASMVEGYATCWHFHCDRIGNIVPAFLHFCDDRFTFYIKFNSLLFTELMGSGAEVQTPIFNRDIVDCHPGG